MEHKHKRSKTYEDIIATTLIAIFITIGQIIQTILQITFAILTALAR